MRWSHLFGSAIRNRGFLYYKNGHVEKVHKAGNTYTGTVTGSSSHIYRVTVTVKNDVVRSMSCTCPYAQGGISCKHEAAVLYMIEQEPELIQDLVCKTRKTGPAFRSTYFRSAYGFSRRIHLLSPGRNGKVPFPSPLPCGKRHWILCVKASLN